MCMCVKVCEKVKVEGGGWARTAGKNKKKNEIQKKQRFLSATFLFFPKKKKKKPAFNVRM